MSDKDNTEEITLTIDKEKMRALKIYGKEKHLSVIDELHNAFESLYTKTVPQSVRNYIAMKQQTSTENPSFDEGDGS